MSYDDWIQFQRDNHRSYEFLDLIQGYASQAGKRAGYRRKELSTVRSFFLHNRVALPPDLSFRVRGEVPKVLGTLSVADVKMILASSNAMYRAAFTAMFMGGMGQSELLYWNMNGLESTLEQLDRNARFLRIDLPGRKKRRNLVPYFTIVGRDAIKLLKIYLKEHRPNGVGDHIFYNQFNEPLQHRTLYEYWKRQTEKLGIITVLKGDTTTRHGKNLHEVRDLFRTRWEKSPAKGVTAEYLMGHVVDPLEYNKAFRDYDYVLSEYVQAERWLNILSDDPEVIPRAQLDVLRVDLEQRNDAQQLEIQALKRRQEATEQLMRELLESDVGLKKRRDRDG